MDTTKKMKLRIIYQMIIFIVSLIMTGVIIAIPAHYVLDMGNRLTELELKVETLELEVKTNKRLVKATQEMVVPDEIALKEDVNG